MTTTTTISTDPAPTQDYSQEVILAACLVIALIFLLLGLRWAKRRRHEHEDEHLVVDMAEPESLDDMDRRGRG